MKLIPIMTRKGFSVGNPGDVFICLGLQYLLSKTLKEIPQYFYFDKFSASDFAKNQHFLKEAGFLIYAGTPQYNNYDDWCLWYDWGVWQQYIIPLDLKFHTIAGGAGYPDPHMTPAEFSVHCRKSVKTESIMRQKIHRTGLTTVRDEHSYKLLSDLGADVSLLPCTATWAAKYLGVTRVKKPSYLGLVLPGPSILRPELVGVKTEKEAQGVLIDRWRDLYNATREKNPLFICHGETEYLLLKEKGLPAYFTNDVLALMRVYASCHSLVSSRLHACLPGLGLGIRNIVSVPIDTRGNAAKVLNIPEIPISEFNVDSILHALRGELDPTVQLSSAEQQYIQLLGDTFNE